MYKERKKERKLGKGDTRKKERKINGWGNVTPELKKKEKLTVVEMWC